MKQGAWRWTAWGAALLLALPLPALALSVGDMRARSMVGEPLRLELTLSDLRGVPASEISVALAWAEDHHRLGVPYPEWGEQLRSFIVAEAGNRATLYLNSPQRMTGPGVTMLLRIVWPGNLILQQVYVTLPEPERARPAPPVALPAPAPAAPAADAAAAPAAEPAAAPRANYSLPDPAWVPYQPQRSAPPPEPQPESEPAAAPEPATIIPAAPAARPRPLPPQPVAPVPGQQVRVKSGDTLSRVASAWPVPGLSLAQRQQLILRNNPHAFIGGDRNRLRADVVLTLPEPDLPPPEAAERALPRPAEVARPALPLPASGRPEVRLTLIAPGQEGAAPAVGQAGAGAPDGQNPGPALAAAEARRDDLLGQREQLRLRLQHLDARSAEQDRRLRVLDARLASFGQAPATARPELVETRARQDVMVWGGVVLLLAVLLALFIFRRARRRPDSLLDKG